MFVWGLLRTVAIFLYFLNIEQFSSLYYGTFSRRNVVLRCFEAKSEDSWSGTGTEIGEVEKFAVNKRKV